MNKLRKFLIAVLTTVMVASIGFFAACTNNDDNDGGYVPVKADGQSTLLQTDKSPEELTPDEVIYSYLYKQSQFTSYKITTTGSTYASKGIINYTQNINNVSIKHGDEYFAESVSTSTFVNLTHQSFAKTVDGEAKIAYRNSADGDISTATRAKYKEVYGVSPDDVALGGYIINDNTVKSFSVDLSNKTQLVYTVVLKADSDEGLGAMKAQMKQFGGLNSLPVFSDVKLTLTLKNDWTPVSLVTEASYAINIAVLGEMNCTQVLTATYSDVNGNVEIPDTQAFNTAVGSTPSEVVSGGTQKPPLYQIAETFASYDWATGRVFDLSAEVSIGDGKQEAAAEVYAKYNAAAIENGDYFGALNFYLNADLSGFVYTPTLVTALNSELYPVAENINAATLYYIGDGNLYVTLSDLTDGTVYLIESVNLGEKLGALIGSINLGGLTSIDVDDLVTQIEQSFDVTETNNQISFVLKNEILDEINLLLSGGDAAIENMSLVANKADDKITGLGVNASISVSDITISFSAELNDGGALAAGRADADAQKVYDILEDESAAQSVRESIAELSYIKGRGEVYYQSYVESLRNKYSALSDEQKALVTNSGAIPSEDGEVSVMPAVFNAIKELASYDYESGMHFGIDLDIGLLGTLMDTSMMVKGDLYCKVDEAALSTGNLAEAVNFRLDVDITDFNSLISLIIMFGGSMIPDDILPIDVSALQYLHSASLFYIGDGNLYVVLNRGERNENYEFVNAELPLAFFEVPMTAPVTGSETSASSILELVAALGDPIVALKGFEGMFTATDTTTGITISLNQEYVTQIDAGYNDLIESLMQSLDSTISSILSNMVSAQIDGVKIEIENNGVFRGVNFLITGIPAMYKEYGFTDSIVLLGLYLTPETVLTGELDGSAEYISNVKSDSEKAAVVMQTIAELSENVRLEQSYLDALDEVDSAYEALTDAQKSMVTNAQTLSGYVMVDTTTYLRNLYTQLKDAADKFIEYQNKGWDTLTEDEWSAVNALYESSTAYPPIKNSIGSQEYIGEENIEAYLNARMAYENSIVQELKDAISAADMDDIANEDDMRELLNLYYSEIKTKYEKLSDESKALIPEYETFVYNTLKVNLENLTAAMTELTNEIQEYVDADEITYDELIALYTKYNNVTAWYSGNDLLNWYIGTTSTTTLSYINWMNQTFPDELSTEVAAMKNAYENFSALTKSYAQSGDMSVLTVNFLTEWYPTSGLPQSNDEAKAAIAEGSLTAEEAEEIYGQVAYIYYICNRVGSSAVKVTVGESTEYVYSILGSYRTTLKNYIDSLSDENA